MWTCASCGEPHDDIIRDCPCGTPRGSAAPASAANDSPPREIPPDQRQPAVVVARPVEYAPAPPKPAPAIELPSLTRRDAGMDLAMVAFVTLAMPILGGFVMALAGASYEAEEALSLSIVGKWIEAVMLCGIAFYLCARHRLPAASVGLRSNGMAGQFAWGAGGLVACYGWVFLSAISVIPFLPWIAQDLEQRQKVFELLPVNDIGRQIALFVAVAIHEELWFRGLFLPYLRKVIGRWWVAVLISASIFGALHITQGIVAVFQVTGLGIVLGMLFVRTRSLLTVMIAHFLFDFIQTLMAPKLMRWMEDASRDLA